MSETGYSNKEYQVEITSRAHAFETGKPAQRGSTNADERDMEMLGRTQVLNVRGRCPNLTLEPEMRDRPLTMPRRETSASCRRWALPARL